MTVRTHAARRSQQNSQPKNNWRIELAGMALLEKGRCAACDEVSQVRRTGARSAHGSGDIHPAIPRSNATSAITAHTASSQNACQVRLRQQTAATPSAPVRLRSW